MIFFKLKKNIPKAGQDSLGATPAPGERINNFVTRLSSLAEHCEYGEEKDNMGRDQVLTHIKDKNLKSNLQSNLDYLDLDYPDYSFIRTFFSGPNFFMNIN